MKSTKITEAAWTALQHMKAEEGRTIVAILEDAVRLYQEGQHEWLDARLADAWGKEAPSEDAE